MEKIKESNSDKQKDYTYYKDQDGEKWCNCINPKLVSSQGIKGTAFCLKCCEYWFH